MLLVTKHPSFAFVLKIIIKMQMMGVWLQAFLSSCEELDCGQPNKVENMAIGLHLVAGMPKTL
jgi:hypothetical protein